jgi:NAD(P)H dehydrogenase (quinone)
VLTSEAHNGAVYELAGDEAFTMAQLAAEVGRQVGRAIVYTDMPQQAYAQALISAGVPAGFANVLADSDVGITRGELNDSTHQLRKLIGRSTTPLSKAVADGLGAR